MRKTSKTRTSIACGLAVAVAWSVIGVESAQARPQYKAGFEQEYPEVSEKNGTEGKVTCFVCHPEKEKKKRNAYGDALTKALGKTMIKDKEEISKAFKKVEGEKSAVEGKTYGDLLKEGKLPNEGEGK